MSDESSESSNFNPLTYKQKQKQQFNDDDDGTFQSKLKDKLLILTRIPQYVYEAIDKNNKNPSELSKKLQERLGVNSFTDFIERFKGEVERRKDYEGFEKFSGPVCGIISSQLKQILILNTIEDFLIPDPSEVQNKFERVLHEKQRKNLTSVIQIFGSLNPELNLEHEFFIWICNQMCRITIDYNEVGCDKNFKCIALVTQQDKKSQKKKKEKKLWILLGKDNVLTICDSQGETEGTPIPVDVFSFSKKSSKHSKSKDGESTALEMNVHQFPSTIRTKFDIDPKKCPAFERRLWEYDCLRVKNVPFYRSLGYDEPKYNPSYIEAASSCILHPLALVLRALFSYDDYHNTNLNPSQSAEIFKSFFDLYLSEGRAYEMINVMVVEGLIDNIQQTGTEKLLDSNNSLEGADTKPQATIFPMYGVKDTYIENMMYLYKQEPEGQNNDFGKKSFLTFFTIWFLERYSNNYFNRVIQHIVSEIEQHPSLEEKNVEESINLISFFVKTIIDNEDQISPQIHYFANVLQNFVVVEWNDKLYLYEILKEFFFNLYIYRMIRVPRFWDNKFTYPNQNKRSPEEIKKAVINFIKMIDIFLSPTRHIELENEILQTKADTIHKLQNEMFEFIMRLPILTLDHCLNQDVSFLQKQNAISFILMVISEHPQDFKDLVRKKELRLAKTPIFYSVAHFTRCLFSDKQGYGLLNSTDRHRFNVNFRVDDRSGYSEEEEEEEAKNVPNTPNPFGSMEIKFQSLSSEDEQGKGSKSKKRKHSSHSTKKNSSHKSGKKIKQSGSSKTRTQTKNSSNNNTPNGSQKLPKGSKLSQSTSKSSTKLTKSTRKSITKVALSDSAEEEFVSPKGGSTRPFSNNSSSFYEEEDDQEAINVNFWHKPIKKSSGDDDDDDDDDITNDLDEEDDEEEIKRPKRYKSQKPLRRISTESTDDGRNGSSSKLSQTTGNSSSNRKHRKGGSKSKSGKPGKGSSSPLAEKTRPHPNDDLF